VGSSGRAPGQRVTGQSPPEAESLLALQHQKEVENLALLNDFLVVFKVSITVRSKPDLGAITMSLDIMISQKPVVTQNLLPSNDSQHSL